METPPLWLTFFHGFQKKRIEMDERKTTGREKADFEKSSAALLADESSASGPTGCQYSTSGRPENRRECETLTGDSRAQHPAV
jgi:hypothetical protein